MKRIVLDKPVTVAQGPRLEDAGWGPWQFPTIGMADDGTVFASIHPGEDDEAAYETVPLWYKSYDKGKTWEETTAQDAVRCMVKLPSGDRMQPKMKSPVKVPEEIFENMEKVYTVPGYADIYEFDGLPEGVVDRAWEFKRLSKDGKLYDFKGEIRNWPHMSLTKTANGVLPPFPFGRLRVAPDGALWAMHYCHPITPDTGEPLEFNTQFYFRSADEGKTWDMASWIDQRKAPDMLGSCESDITWTADGTAVTVIRSSGTYVAVSKDGGFTWDRPWQLDEIGVDPAIRTLGCGAIIASYGRPGFFVRGCFDGKGEVWDEPVEIIGNYDHSGEMNEPTWGPGPGRSWGTCSYSDILPISDTEALVVYTDFFVPDKEGVKRKSLMVVKVAVEGE